MNSGIKQILFALFCVIITSDATGQDIDFYKSKLGLRFGQEIAHTSIGFSAEIPLVAADGELSINFAGPYTKFTFLYKVYNDLEFDDVPNLRYYYGLGPSILSVGSAERGGESMFYGGEVSVGIDYSFDDNPLIVGLEIKPAYYFSGFGQYIAQFALFCKFDLADHKAK